ncbi:hypothetical protein CNYM01_00266 [Colletotrichum nymphaeae SA-01]|uniref:Uncharacterized protein n=1 Tax=Colletotrichum nymphaeae SA-01 TaxID=1460502 RepID=A0A135U7K3_9PEZI|nr:hypothetical protein CNYM01_00266 [Colletotrichum nymphaeae SA-01]
MQQETSSYAIDINQFVQVTRLSGHPCLPQTLSSSATATLVQRCASCTRPGNGGNTHAWQMGTCLLSAGA